MRIVRLTSVPWAALKRATTVWVPVIPTLPVNMSPSTIEHGSGPQDVTVERQ